MAVKKWNIGYPDKDFAKKAAEICEADPFAALIAGTRNIKDLSELEIFLSDEPVFSDPNLLSDIKKAAEIIKEAVSEGKKIAVFGDYDCDGVASTALMFEYLKSKNADVITYIPDRISEGYGMNKQAVDILKNKGVELIITVDNGISAFDEIAYANSLELKTVVTDHHIPPEVLPEAEAVVDPHRADDISDFKDICGAMVAFKLVCVIEEKEPEQLLDMYSDLVAMATVGDVMPLVNENRCIVKSGLKYIRNNKRAGVNALISVAGLNRNDIDSSRLSFGLIPRINAAGRMGDANRAFELLLCKDSMRALSLANEIDSENAKRQSMEKEISKSACEIIERNGYNHNRVIVVCGKNWHSGVLGIVAARITEKYGRPSIIMTEEDGVCHGSGRSFKGFNLHEALSFCGNLLLKFGGHELAAGMSIEKENIEDFRKRINIYALNNGNSVPELNIDFKINPAALNLDMAYSVKALEPFGNSNPVPVFAVLDCEIVRIMPLSSGKHTKLLLNKGNTSFQALAFGVKTDEFCFNAGEKIDVAICVGINEFKGEHNLSVQIKGIRPSGFKEEEYFNSLFSLDDYLSGLKESSSEITPTREEVGIVYKKIIGKKIRNESIKYILSDEVSYAKAVMSLNVLEELNLAGREGEIIFGIPSKEKTSLNSSKIYNKLLKEV